MERSKGNPKSIVGDMSWGKVAVFIDGGYWTKVLREFKSIRVNLLDFSDHVCLPGYRIRTNFYDCKPFTPDKNASDEEKMFYTNRTKFLTTVNRLPRFKNRYGMLVRRGEGFIQKRVDIMLATEMVAMAWGNQIDRVVIVSGDNDLVPAINLVGDAGVITKLYFAPFVSSNELIDACDEREALTEEFLKQFSFK